ncbi:MAG: YbdK family carboxylate-amine ligase [Propionibacteriaceae bacterium]|nr:YbdK family carboxylate-amine ligase [Propionibacteriaceae bacterium]
MRIDFASSAFATLGLEWELALIDPASGEQVPAAPQLLQRVTDPKAGPIRGEFLDSMVELVTGVHAEVGGAVAELAGLRDQLLGWCDADGVAAVGMGAHPWQDPRSQYGDQDNPQYRRVRQAGGWWAEQLAINGLHIHIGLDDKDLALPLTQALTRFCPLLIALSASSPFWLGTDTGFASQRTMLFQQLPTNGLPWPISTWEDYLAHAEDLRLAGMIDNPTQIRWDVRPTAFGTVEIRAMDSVPTLTEIAALAALAQSFALWFRRNRGRCTPGRPWFLKENKWRSARHGFAAELIEVVPGRFTTPLTQAARWWTEELTPSAEELGCAAELAAVSQLLEIGPSHQRQRAVWERSQNLPDVLRSVIDETRTGSPRTC